MSIHSTTKLLIGALSTLVGFQSLVAPGIAATDRPVSSPNAGDFAPAPAQLLAQATGKTPPRMQRVKVFFPKNPNQQASLGYVEPVWRQVSHSGVAQFVLEQLVAGPTTPEKRLGFVAPITLKGPSTCGKDFSLSITTGVAKVQFCRLIVTGGIGDDARITSAVNASLKQFPAIRSTVILDQRGNCFGDMSGENFCLRR